MPSCRCGIVVPNRPVFPGNVSRRGFPAKVPKTSPKPFGNIPESSARHRPKRTRPTGPIFSSLPSEPSPEEEYADSARMRIGFSDGRTMRHRPAVRQGLYRFSPILSGRNPRRDFPPCSGGIRFQNGTSSAPFSLRQEHRRNRPPATNLRPSVGRAHPSVRRSGARPARRSFPRPK